ncbi:ABC transporter substrate-binding protein [Facklamia sp. DSM 111018]|uniref:ABC transporter substrate-binding protein n=1 Tax=Facklamia lactis TaxID=2749967 RepID=A0ABS0LSW4_9LACT|nr:ABC transporter substrate-binding protein [Facklamia lactis]MBG9981351.1 ABC transporter substrate-binding protein [Facklamia lactis]MBG9987173.1 ABC transporter substrate-binding protein [Facklamia lactis]
MKRKLGLLVLLVLAIFNVAGCSGAGGGETLTVATSGDAISLDPVATNDNQSSHIMNQIYEGLVKINENGEAEPSLAESIEQPDDSTYVFKLKQGIKFHNGEELKASDVVFSLKRAIEAPNVKHLFETIDINSLKAVDDYTVEFKQTEPFSGILAALCHPGGYIVNEKAVTDAGDDYTRQPVGTGAVKFVKWTKADSIELERYEDYHGEKTAYKTLLFRVIPEPSNRVIELESGGVDIAYDIAANDMEKIEGNEKLQLLKSFDYGTTYLGFNTQKEPFNDPKVREAISYAIDIDSIVSAVFRGLGKTASGVMSPTLQYSISDSMQPRARDVEKAKKLLEEAGFGDGFSTSISTNENKDRIDMATAMKEQLAEVGIDVSINVLEWSAFNELLKKGEQEMFEIAWTADSPDPDTFLYPCFHSSSAGEGGNYIYLDDPEIDKLLEEARFAKEDSEREDLYRQVQEKLMEITAWVPEHNKELTVGAQKEIQNLKLSPFGWYQLAPVTKSAE